MIIYPYEFSHCWWRLVETSILNRGTMISHRIGIVCRLRWFTTLLYYRHQFIGSLYAVEVGHTPEYLVSRCNIHSVLECSWLSIMGCWVNFRIWFWGIQYSYGSQQSPIWAHIPWRHGLWGLDGFLVHFCA